MNAELSIHLSALRFICSRYVTWWRYYVQWISSFLLSDEASSFRVGVYRDTAFKLPQSLALYFLTILRVAIKSAVYRMSLVCAFTLLYAPCASRNGYSNFCVSGGHDGWLWQPCKRTAVFYPVCCNWMRYRQDQYVFLATDVRSRALLCQQIIFTCQGIRLVLYVHVCIMLKICVHCSCFIKLTSFVSIVVTF
jgi:hypothetical protein